MLIPAKFRGVDRVDLDVRRLAQELRSQGIGGGDSNELGWEYLVVRVDAVAVAPNLNASLDASLTQYTFTPMRMKADGGLEADSDLPTGTGARWPLVERNNLTVPTADFGFITIARSRGALPDGQLVWEFDYRPTTSGGGGLGWGPFDDSGAVLLTTTYQECMFFDGVAAAGIYLLAGSIDVVNEYGSTRRINVGLQVKSGTSIQQQIVLGSFHTSSAGDLEAYAVSLLINHSGGTLTVWLNQSVAPDPFSDQLTYSFGVLHAIRIA